MARDQRTHERADAAHGYQHTDDPQRQAQRVVREDQIEREEETVEEGDVSLHENDWPHQPAAKPGAQTDREVVVQSWPIDCPFGRQLGLAERP